MKKSATYVHVCFTLTTACILLLGFSALADAHTFFASFTINATSGAGGSISPSGNVIVTSGANQTFTMNPNTGKYVDSVLVDGVNQGQLSTYTFLNVLANHTIRVIFATIKDTIFSSSGPHGSTSPSGSVLVNYGGSKTFTITPAASYHVDSVIVDGVNQGPETTYTFTGVTTNHTIRSVFAVNQYAITAAAGPNGVITPSGTVLVNSGANKTFTITPGTGYHVDTVYVDNVSQGAITSYTFTNVTTNHTISAAFAIIKDTITATSQAHGTMSPAGAVIVNYGGSQSFTATPDTGYHVDSLFVDGVNQGPLTSYTFTNVTSNHRIRGSFAINQYTITATSGANGSTSPSGAVVLKYGANQTFTITPNTGYHVDTVYVDNASQGAITSYTFSNVTANHTISAVFAINQYTINATAKLHGTISPIGAVVVNYGADQSFVATPDTGYHVDTLFVDGVSQGQLTSYTFTNVTSNHNIKATFAINQYTILATAGLNGTISPIGAIVANYGANRQFTVTPDTGYHVDSLLVDGANVGQLATYTFNNITSDHTIRAVFAINQFTITATAQLHGTISPIGAVVVNHGADQSFVLIPDTGYHVDSLFVDGMNQGPLTAYTFTNVTSNHRIRGSFAINQYAILASAGPNGTMTPSGAVLANYGANRQFTVTPDTGYHVDSLLVDGANVGQLATYTFNNITSDHTIRAAFAIDQFTITSSAKGHGIIVPDSTITVDYGLNQSYTAIPDTGYHVDSLMVDGVNLGQLSAYTFTNVFDNHRIKAIFNINQFVISATAGSNGTISPAGDVAVNYGANQLFTFSPDSGYRVDSLFIDGTYQGHPLSYNFRNVVAGHSLRVTFVLSQFTIHSLAGLNGSITPSGAIGVAYGGSQSFVVIPDTGYHVDSLLVDSVDVGPLTSYTFTNVTANHKIRASFAINQYIITASAGAHGTITPGGILTVKYGATRTFSINPDSGYHVDSVFVDGVNQGRLKSYTFTNVDTGHTIRAVFFAIQSTITVITAIDVNGNGISESQDTASLPAGGVAKILLSRNGVSVDSIALGDGILSSYTFYISQTGNYKVRETDITQGWMQTDPGSHSTDISGANVQDTAVFLNFKLVAVRGTAFNDRNRNGVNDIGEPGLQGWIIQANGTGGRFRTTGLNGQYTINGLGPGRHTIAESTVTDWAQSLPPAGSYTFDAMSGEDQSGFDFGNYNTMIVGNTISGVVFADVAQDSMKNPPDFGLRNWKVLLSPALSPGIVDTATTDRNGFFIFSNLAPGNYLLSEVRKPKSIQTYPPTSFYNVTINVLGTPVVDQDFGNYRHVTSDTARTVVTSDVIAALPSAQVLKGFQFSVPAPAPAAEQKAALAVSAGDTLPVGTIVTSWDGTVLHDVVHPEYFYWLDLNGDLKFGHSCMFVFVDQAAQAETVDAQWWPVVQLPEMAPVEVWSSWDDRVTSSDIFYGGYGAGNTPLAPHKAATFTKIARHESNATTALSGTCALLVGGKAESATELATWQHDLDSVRSVLVQSNPPAVDAGKIVVANDVASDELFGLMHEFSACDTLYLYFTGHGDGSAGGGIVFGNAGGMPGRTSVSYASLSASLFDSLSLKRIYALFDASNSGNAIDDFLKSKRPVVNLVTSTDAQSSARSGLPADTQSTYTKIWERTAFGALLSPAARANWRQLNKKIRTDNASLAVSQNPPDTSNAPVFVSGTLSVNFPNILVGDSASVVIGVANAGYIPLAIDSIQTTGTDFFIQGASSGTIARNGNASFTLVFKPDTQGSRSANITFFDNGEVTTQFMIASGYGIERFDTLKFRTFTQDSLALKPVKKKPYATRFIATIPNTADWTRAGVLVQFSVPVTITSSDPFIAPPQSGDGGLGKSWVFTGSTVAVRHPVTIVGIARSRRPVRVSSYTWISDNPADNGQRLFLSPAIPPNQQPLLPMPNAGNFRDVVFQISNYFTNGLVVGVRLDPPASKQFGWICIQKSKYLSRFFLDKGATQSGDPRQLDIVGIHLFTGEQKNLSPLKYSNHLAGELAALHFNIMSSALAVTPPGLGELIYDDSTGGALNGLSFRAIADSADAMLTYRWGPPSMYLHFDSVITTINRAFSGPMDTISFGSQLRAKGVKPANAARHIHPSSAPPVRIEARTHNEDVPEQFALYQNYPNPFNPTTTIEFDLDAPSLVTLRVYNILGEEIATLLDRKAMDDGPQQIDFSANGLPSGVYFYRIEVQSVPDQDAGELPLSKTMVKKMLLLK